MKLQKQYKGRFRVEFLACLPEIQNFVAKGYSAPMIYDEMHSVGKITMSYGQFYRYFKTQLVPKAEIVPENNSVEEIHRLSSKSTEDFLPAIKTPVSHYTEANTVSITKVAATIDNLVK